MRNPTVPTSFQGRFMKGPVLFAAGLAIGAALASSGTQADARRGADPATGIAPPGLPITRAVFPPGDDPDDAPPGEAPASDPPPGSD